VRNDKNSEEIDTLETVERLVGHNVPSSAEVVEKASDIT
jgi:hypothetical protein